MLSGRWARREAQRVASTKVANPVPAIWSSSAIPLTTWASCLAAASCYDTQKPGTLSGLHVIWTWKDVSYGSLLTTRTSACCRAHRAVPAGPAGSHHGLRSAAEPAGDFLTSNLPVVARNHRA